MSSRKSIFVKLVKLGNLKQISQMADESLTNFASAQRLISARTCNAFNLKISKHGGLFRTLQIAQLAKKHGVPCQLGAHFGETSILTTAGIVLSGLLPDLTAHEGAMGTLILQEDISYSSIHIDHMGRIEHTREIWKDGGWGLSFAPPRELIYR